MKKPELWPILPQEMGYGVVLGVMLCRLAGAKGLLAPITCWCLGWLAILVLIIYWSHRRESELRWRWRLGLSVLLMNVIYFTLGVAVPIFHPGKEDAVLQYWDQLLVGGNLSLRLHSSEIPILTELFSICYLAFFPLLALSWLYYFRRELPVLRRFICGMFTVYAVGFMGYMWLPALGPYLDPGLSSQFQASLEGGWFTRLEFDLILRGSNRVDAFPSLHCSVTAFILFFDRQYSPLRFWLFLIPTVGLWIATIYLRYHYFLDMFAGFLLAAAVLFMLREKSSRASL